MEKNSGFHLLIVVAMLCVAFTQAAAQAAPSTTGVPVSLVLTLRGHHPANMSALNSGNLIVTAGRDRAKVTDVLPLQAGQAGLELYIMMDNVREISYGTQVEDIRHFILAQPLTTKIGVVYMNIEGPTIVQDLTTDHSLAAHAVTTPLAKLANGESPYTSLNQLIDKWPASNDRREVVMISKGEDSTFGDSTPDQDNPYLDTAIEKAQRSGIIVFTIAIAHETPRLPENGPAFIPVPPTRDSLAEIGPRGAVPGKYDLGWIAESTGGEYYYYKSSATLSFAPYLADIRDRLGSQYLVKFLPTPGKKPGLESVKVRSELPHTEAVTAKKVYVPGPTLAER